MFPIRKILHPTDFSEHSKAAFEVACALARDYSAELVVIHVHQMTPIYAPDGIVVGVPVEVPYEAHAKLAQMKPSDPRVNMTHFVVEGEPADQILKAAREHSADLIVLGTHGTTGLARLLMGSVAETVLRKAPCPVLTVRSTFSKEAKA